MVDEIIRPTNISRKLYNRFVNRVKTDGKDLRVELEKALTLYLKN